MHILDDLLLFVPILLFYRKVQCVFSGTIVIGYDIYKHISLANCWL